MRGGPLAVASRESPRAMQEKIDCASCPLTRRRFLAGCAAGCLAPALGGLGDGEPPVRIRIVYSLHAPVQDRPDWPNAGFDFRPVMARLEADLSRLCPGFRFVAAQAAGPAEAKAILEADREAPVDGYLVLQLNCWNQVVQTLAGSGKPVLYADFKYGGSGGFLVYTAAFLRAGAPNVGFVSSSRIEDLAAAVACFRGTAAGGFAAAVAEVRRQGTPAPGEFQVKEDPVKCIAPEECAGRLKETRILAYRNQEERQGPVLLGIPVLYRPFAELNEAWKAADREQARAVAERWRKGAERVEGVPAETLEASAAMYLAQRRLLERHGASGITIDCLGGFYGGHIHAYPCLGFFQLANEGLVGACECDIRSAAIMAAGTALTGGRPGYISDPVIDTARRRIIYAHCVASNRVFGPGGPANPYQILTHSEDRQGAAVRSLLPAGYMTTALEVSRDGKEILLHRARAAGNDPDDRACRTKLEAEPVGEFEKLFREWDRWGWHRVTFYGDLEKPVRGLAEALGCKVVEEA